MKKSSYYLNPSDVLVTMSGGTNDGRVPVGTIGTVVQVEHSGWYVDYLVWFEAGRMEWVGAEWVAHLPS